MPIDQCVSYVHYLVKSDAPDEGISCNIFERLLEQLAVTHAEGSTPPVSRETLLSVVDLFHRIILQRPECPNIVCIVLAHLELLPHAELFLEVVAAAVPLIANKNLVGDLFNGLKGLVLRAIEAGGHGSVQADSLDVSTVGGFSARHASRQDPDRMLIYAVKIMVELSPMLDDRRQLAQLLDAVDLVVGGDGCGDESREGSCSRQSDAVYVELSLSVFNNLPSSPVVADKLVHSFLRQVRCSVCNYVGICTHLDLT
jgi:hypothetical protein